MTGRKLILPKGFDYKDGKIVEKKRWNSNTPHKTYRAKKRIRYVGGMLPLVMKNKPKRNTD